MLGNRSAAHVACAAAAVAACWTAPAAVAARSPRTTFVLHGVVVQYIPPGASVVGSLSVRVARVGARGRLLIGELVTVPIAPGRLQDFVQGSVCTLTLRAQSPGSILNGKSTVQEIVSGDAFPAPSGPESHVPPPSTAVTVTGNGQPGNDGAATGSAGDQGPPPNSNAGGAPAANQTGGGGQGGGQGQSKDGSEPAPSPSVHGPTSPPGPHG